MLCVSGFCEKTVLAHPHGHQRGGGVRVVGRADGDGVDFLPISSSILRKSLILLRLGRSSPALPSVLSSMSQMATMSPCRLASFESLLPLPPTPIQREANTLVGRLAFGGRGACGDPEADAGGRRGFQEVTTIRVTTHVRNSFEQMREIVLSADRFGKIVGCTRRAREVGKHSAACPGGCIMPLRGRPGWARLRWFSYAVRFVQVDRATQAAWGTALGFVGPKVGRQFFGQRSLALG